MNDILKIIDHTLLRQDITAEDLQRHCAEAAKYGFATVVVHPAQVARAAALLSRAAKVCTVAGFPFGEDVTEIKASSARVSVGLGAQEIDMVMRISAAKQGDWQAVTADIAAVTAAAGVPVKVIIETALLTEREIIRAAQCCIEGGAAFVKTSTGYFGQGATVENVALLASVCGGKIKVKAAGGVRTLDDARAMINAGAQRIGTSAGVAIAGGLTHNGTY